MTLYSILRRQYEQDARYMMSSAWDADEPGIVDEITNLPEIKKEKLKLLMGHVPFGVHENLHQSCLYFTMLRDPVDLIISLYYYIRSTPKVLEYYSQVNKMKLEDFICSGMANVENPQIRYLRGTTTPFGQDPSLSDLETVKENLQERFAVVGLLERLDESLILLKRIFNWRNVFYIKQNVVHNRPHKEDIPKNTIAAIEKHNALDLELYSYTKDLFDRAIRGQGSSFEYEVNIFRLQNKLYQAVQAFRARLPQLT